MPNTEYWAYYKIKVGVGRPGICSTVCKRLRLTLVVRSLKEVGMLSPRSLNDHVLNDTANGLVDGLVA